MSQSWSRYPAVLLAAAVVAGAPLLAAGPAGAAPVESGRQVTFSSSGGLLGVTCSATPSPALLTIPADTTLRVVNHTGHRATLLLDGAARGEVARGSTAEVLFRRGPVSLALEPHCVIKEKSAARVNVVAAPRATTPDPTPPQPSGAGSSGTDNDRPAKSRPSGSAGGSTADPGPAGTPGRRPVAPQAPSQTGSGAAEPTPAAEDVLPDDSGLIGDGTSVATPPPVEPEGGGLAAEPMASVEPITKRGPVGLLGLLATVCVLGVSIGAIRAILAQRASRTGIA
jgi:hypothetical protein